MKRRSRNGYRNRDGLRYVSGRPENVGKRATGERRIRGGHEPGSLHSMLRRRGDRCGRTACSWTVCCVEGRLLPLLHTLFSFGWGAGVCFPTSVSVEKREEFV